MSAITVEAFDQHTATDDEFDVLFDFLDKMSREFDKEDPLTPRPLRLKQLRQRDSKRLDVRWISQKDGVIIGSATTGFSTAADPGYTTNSKICRIDVQVLHDFRQQGIAKRLARQCMSAIVANGLVQEIVTTSDNPIGQAVNEHYAATEALRSAETRLQMADVDWDMLEKWATAGDELAKAEGVKLQIFAKAPEELIEAYVHMYSEVVNQQPLGEIKIDAQFTRKTRRAKEARMIDEMQLEWRTMISVESDGEMSGLTEMYHSTQMPWRSMQHLTGVRSNYRGRGLGKWLKARMLFWAKDAYPEMRYVVSGNTDSNAPMLSINSRMGFKIHKKDVSYKYTVDHLRDKLM